MRAQPKPLTLAAELCRADTPTRGMCGDTETTHHDRRIEQCYPWMGVAASMPRIVRARHRFPDCQQQACPCSATVPVAALDFDIAYYLR